MSWRNLHTCLSVTAGLIFNQAKKVSITLQKFWIQDPDLIPPTRTKFLDPPLQICVQPKTFGLLVLECYIKGFLSFLRLTTSFCRNPEWWITTTLRYGYSTAFKQLWTRYVDTHGPRTAAHWPIKSYLLTFPIYILDKRTLLSKLCRLVSRSIRWRNTGWHEPLNNITQQHSTQRGYNSMSPCNIDRQTLFNVFTFHIQHNAPFK
jgi:hypothetical protein